MGSMSASDAAPLPRLGEVFFDVRGESRSMRLSWYADTEVAVFSIWQGGTCTGTFRLPITDLPRMVEALQRGPRGQGDPVTGGMTGEQLASREPSQPGSGQPDPTRYQAEPLPADYPREPGGYLDAPVTGGPHDYQTGPLVPDLPHGQAGRHPGTPAAHGSGEYQTQPGPMADDYPGEAPPGYQGEPGTAVYPGGPAVGYPGDYQDRDDPLEAGHSGGHPREGHGGRSRASHAGRGRRGRRGGDPAGPADGGYPGEAGYPGDGGYPADAGYPGEADHPAGGEYPGDADYPGDAGYPAGGGYPARPATRPMAVTRATPATRPMAVTRTRPATRAARRPAVIRRNRTTRAIRKNQPLSSTAHPRGPT